MGDAINMAARLMCLPEAQGGILCDERTYNLADSFFLFSKLGEKTVKGKKKAIIVFKPTSKKLESEISLKRIVEANELIGRGEERVAIEEAIQSLGMEASKSIFICGNEGQGLSSLGQYVCDKLDVENITCWYQI